MSDTPEPTKKSAYELIDNWTKPFWRSTAASENGSGSTARVCTLYIVFAVVIMAGYLVWYTKKVPNDILYLGFFAAILISCVYTPNKISGAFKSFFSKK